MEKKISDVEYDRLKKISTQFFYWWYNAPGNNTPEGFDTWWGKHGYKL